MYCIEKRVPNWLVRRVVARPFSWLPFAFVASFPDSSGPFRPCGSSSSSPLRICVFALLFPWLFIQFSLGGTFCEKSHGLFLIYPIEEKKIIGWSGPRPDRLCLLLKDQTLSCGPDVGPVGIFGPDLVHPQNLVLDQTRTRFIWSIGPDEIFSDQIWSKHK